MKRYTINPQHGFLPLPALIASLYTVDDLTAEEIMSAINDPDGARGRNYDKIAFGELGIEEAVECIVKDAKDAAAFVIELVSAFASLEFGQTVAVGHYTNGRGWYIFNQDLTRDALARLSFYEFYLFERPEDFRRPDTWYSHYCNGDRIAYRLTLTDL